MITYLIGLIIAAFFILVLTILTDSKSRDAYFGALLNQRGSLSADIKTEIKEGVEIGIPVAATKIIYSGAWACVNAAGFLVPGADTAALIFMGISRQYIDNSLGGNGDLTGLLWRHGLIKATLGHAITQANVGADVFLIDDETVDLTANVTNKIFCGVIAEFIDSTHAFIDIEPAIKQADVAVHIAKVTGAHSASSISITDAGNFTAQIDAEAALQEIYPFIPIELADPGASGAIGVVRSGNVPVVTAGAETRTLAIPSKSGMVLAISFKTKVGNCTITAASAINTTGNNTIALTAAGQVIVLIAIKVANALCWRVLVNDGATLTTV